MLTHLGNLRPEALTLPASGVAGSLDPGHLAEILGNVASKIRRRIKPCRWFGHEQQVAAAFAYAYVVRGGISVEEVENAVIMTSHEHTFLRLASTDGPVISPFDPLRSAADAIELARVLGGWTSSYNVDTETYFFTVGKSCSDVSHESSSDFHYALGLVCLSEWAATLDPSWLAQVAREDDLE
ncbi:MAG: hypothetical protein EON58_02285 [Alphaproteobacteria bacterium]|nr:MAG: hypothetical protein EON58_02285 [Alphaproteobacteria bacterium]